MDEHTNDGNDDDKTVQGPGGTADINDNTGNDSTNIFLEQEMFTFQTPCPQCHQDGETTACTMDIPHFKQVILWCLVCQHCGYKSREVKSGGAISTRGMKITLRVCNEEDLKREVIKSDTAGVAIPELDFEQEQGGLDGVYTTVEGLLRKLHSTLEVVSPFAGGDDYNASSKTEDSGEQLASSPLTRKVLYTQFMETLKDYANGKSLPFTLIISDPLSNSFVGPVPRDAVALATQVQEEGNDSCYDEYVDDGLEIQEYERSHEQDELLGLNDIQTEHYQENLQVEQGEQAPYWGTDKMQDLPDKPGRVPVSGPDHPNVVGK